MDRSTSSGYRAEAEYERRVRAEETLLRSLSFLLRPVFAVNHRRAMARGEEGLKREPACRRDGANRERSPAPEPA
jgi:hypothetical protein